MYAPNWTLGQKWMHISYLANFSAFGGRGEYFLNFMKDLIRNKLQNFICWGGTPETEKRVMKMMKICRAIGGVGRGRGVGALGEDARHVTSRPTALPFY